MSDQQTVFSPTIEARIRRDGPMAHFNHIFRLLPDEHPLRDEYRKIWGWYNRQQSPNRGMVGARVTQAFFARERLHVRIVAEVIRLRPEVAEITGPICPDCGGKSAWGTEFGTERVAIICSRCHDFYARSAREHARAEDSDDDRPEI